MKKTCINCGYGPRDMGSGITCNFLCGEKNPHMKSIWEERKEMRKGIDILKPIYIYNDCGINKTFAITDKDIIFKNQDIIVCLIILDNDIEEHIVIYLDQGIVISKELDFYFATNDKEVLDKK